MREAIKRVISELMSKSDAAHRNYTDTPYMYGFRYERDAYDLAIDKLKEVLANEETNRTN